MTQNPLTLTVIIGSIRTRRLAPVVSHWFLQHACGRDDLNLDVIDLLDLDLPIDYGDDGDSDGFRDRVEQLRSVFTELEAPTPHQQPTTPM